jgi:hypothetical protein
MASSHDKTASRREDPPLSGEADEALERDPDTVPNAPNRDPAEPPDSGDLANQSDASDGVPQDGEAERESTA